MALMRIQNSVPEIYENSSRDFQLISRLYDAVYCGVKYDIDSMINIIDTSEIKSSILQLLQSKLGFFTDSDIQDDYLRRILMVFPELIKYKGCKKGIDKAINLFMHLQHKIIDYFILDEIGDNGELYVVLNTPISNLTLLDEILKYILPTGIQIKYISTFEADNSFELGEHISIVNTNSIVDSNVKIPLTEFGASGTTYTIQQAQLITPTGVENKAKTILENSDFDQMLNSSGLSTVYTPIASYDSTASYIKNNVVINNDQAYVCIASSGVSVTGAWNSTYWSAINEKSVYISSTDSNQFDQYTPVILLTTTNPYLFKQTPHAEEPSTLRISNLNDDSIRQIQLQDEQINTVIAPTIQSYNSSNIYNIGDKVTRYRVIYECKQDNTTGTWDSNKWERVN